MLYRNAVSCKILLLNSLRALLRQFVRKIWKKCLSVVNAWMNRDIEYGFVLEISICVMLVSNFLVII